MRMTVWRFAVCLAFSTLVNVPAAARAQATSEEILRELAALRAEVQKLREEVEALKAPVQETVAAREVVQAQLDEFAQTKVESTTRFPLRIFGTIHAHAFANTDTPNWLDIPNVVNAPVADPGTFGFGVRQTRIGFAADGPALGSVRTSGVVAFDFFGGVPGFQTGQTMVIPRMLVAYARLDGTRFAAEVGQDHVVLAPRDPTSLVGFASPTLARSGNLYLRAPQARVEVTMTPLLRAAAGIVAPIGGDLAIEDYRFVPPALGGERSRRPFAEARLELGSADTEAERRAAIAVSGHYGWERRPTEIAETWAAAIDFGARRDVFGVAGEVFVGDNIDAFSGGLGLAAPAAGGWAELQLFPSERLSLNAGYGTDELRGASRFQLARGRNRSAYGNVIMSITPEVQASFEYRWLATLPLGASERANHHFDWVLAYKF